MGMPFCSIASILSLKASSLMLPSKPMAKNIAALNLTLFDFALLKKAALFSSQLRLLSLINA